MGLADSSDESTAMGVPRGGGEGRVERSRSEGSKRRRSSKLGKRKEVSEWALRWWDPRSCGVSGICDMSAATGGGFAVNCDSIFFFFFFFSVAAAAAAVGGGCDGGTIPDVSGGLWKDREKEWSRESLG